MGEVDDPTRLAIVSVDRCKPKKCRQECKRKCPVNRTGKLCIEVTPLSKTAFISEELCVGCNACVKACPFEAIQIINVPSNLSSDVTHRYGVNSFKLHRLPMPRTGQVLGLIGANGTGKTTAIKILANKLKPNLGQLQNPPDWEDILRKYRGSELQNYFTRVMEDQLAVAIKPQEVDKIPKAIKDPRTTVRQLLDRRTKTKTQAQKDAMLDLFELQHLLDREVGALSGGELQRFANATVCLQDVQVYIFDEPTSYLDVRQRIKMVHGIRALRAHNTYVVCVEHDVSILDYMSDYVCCLYGKPGAYGVVTTPFSVRDGINVFLAGFIPTENMRFRDNALTFKRVTHSSSSSISASSAADSKTGKKSKSKTKAEEDEETEEDKPPVRKGHRYAAMTKTFQEGGKFKLEIEAGEFFESEVLVLLGQNGCGKTTLIKLLAGIIDPDDDVEEDKKDEKDEKEKKKNKKVEKMNVSYKPQHITPKFVGTVRQLLQTKILSMYTQPQFVSDVLKPMRIPELLDQELQTLSGGELQRVAITLCLGRPADVYLLDEPSAYLDVEQRITTAQVLKRFCLHAAKSLVVIEHDFVMSTFLANRVAVFTGTPGIEARCESPTSVLAGMNAFLKQLGVTFRRDSTNHRPRINKLDSVKDRAQKQAGTYFFMDQDDDDDNDRDD